MTCKMQYYAKFKQEKWLFRCTAFLASMASLHSMQHLMQCQQHVNSKDTDLKNKWSWWSTCSNESTGLLPRNWHQSFMPSVELAVDHIAD